MLLYAELKSHCKKLLAFTEAERVSVLENIAQKILDRKVDILEANQKDVAKATEMGLSPILIDRLILSDSRIESLRKACLDIASQQQVVGIFEEEVTQANGLLVKTQRIPLGLLAMIFESRPNVVVDALALAIKSANGLILKGGKEAKFSNNILFSIVNDEFQKKFHLPVFLLLDDRNQVEELLLQKDHIDLVIARGGSALVEYVKKNAQMPVMAHDKGLCHLYVHKDAKREWVSDVVINAKISRPGVCNALETLLIHERYDNIAELLSKLLFEGVEIHGCLKSKALNDAIVLAKETDYETEYLDKKLSVKIVSHEDEAIEHIKKYSSLHTEAILTQDDQLAYKFINSLESSCIVVNSSTRFNDGGELGLGAELGISTSKFHAFGPVGAKQMTTKRFVVFGQGQIRR
jgi:glutamate-5-semialdehyde dehydrogenase